MTDPAGPVGYTDFKQNQKFNDLMKAVNGGAQCAYVRRLAPTRDVGTTRERFYSVGAVLVMLDHRYPTGCA